jgi:hypothetical protein
VTGVVFGILKGGEGSKSEDLEKLELNRLRKMRQLLKSKKNPAVGKAGD